MKNTFKEIISKRKYEFFGIILIVLAILNIINLLSKDTGIIGDNLAYALRVVVGQGIYVVPVFLLIWGIAMIHRSKFKVEISSRMIGVILILLVILITLHLEVEPSNELKIGLAGQGGGVVGGAFLFLLRTCFADLGTYVILAAVALIGLLLVLDVLLINLLLDFKRTCIDGIKKISAKLKPSGLKKIKFNPFNKVKKKDSKRSKTKKSKDRLASKKKVIKRNNSHRSTEAKREVAASSEDKKDNRQVKEVKKPVIQEKFEFDESRLPHLSLLDEVGESQVAFNDQTEILEDTLENFGVEAEVVDVNYGPTITRYEIQPAPGVKVSKILSLSDDIALSLAASDVRIEAPIPGKAAVGIEIPNLEQAMVTVKEILASDEFIEAESKLTMALGKDIAGQTVVADLGKMPHMLVAGATGSGKSVFINSIINSILYKATSDEVKFLLIDPKMVELTIYKDIPHLVAPVVTDAKKAATALRWVVQEMENRYELFAGSGARGIDSYNRKISQEGSEPLPYIVVIIDELADLMMVSAKAVEDAICRLAQKARAAGIHLILATQRPSVDVITGVIKANIPTRVSFALSSQADSRTILDSGGAEKLLGKGDMLFAPVDANQPKRIQGAFISDDELKRVVSSVKAQEKPDYAKEIAEIKNKDIEIELDDDKDELYQKAVKLVVKNRASISMLQRKLRIGYNRAARMIDTMEKENIVGEHRGSKAREVLIKEEELEDLFNQK